MTYTTTYISVLWRHGHKTLIQFVTQKGRLRSMSLKTLVWTPSEETLENNASVHKRTGQEFSVGAVAFIAQKGSN